MKRDKSNKIRIICLFISFFLLINCKNENLRDEGKIKKTSVILYYTNKGLTTTIPVKCKNFLTELKHSIYYLNINELSFINELKANINIEDTIENTKTIDVRYRIEIDNLILCFDEYGYYSVNNNYKGKFSYFNEILKYVEENKDYSEKLEKLPN